MASELLGFAELNRRLVELGKSASGKELRNALFQASLPAVKGIAAAAPVGSRSHKTYLGREVGWGFLSRSVRRKNMLRTGNAHAVVLIGVAPEAFYAQFIERGTKYQAARPFMERAFQSSQSAILTRFAERLERVILKAARR
jgi:HK97 gp10 family phage protein